MVWELMLPMHTNKAVIVKQLPPKGFQVGQHGHVRYEAHIHPTYRTPCLWFSLYGLPADEDPLSIDTVFRRLVPDHFKAGMRASTGTLDGISLGVGPSFLSFGPEFLGDARYWWLTEILFDGLD